MSHADSVRAWKEAVPERTTADKASDVAAEIVFLPFRALFYGAQEGIRILTTPREPTWIVKAFYSPDGRRRTIPIASPTRGAGLKFKYKPNPEVKANISVMAAGWFYGRQTYRLAFDNWTIAPRFQGSFAGEYHIHPEERFYGFGMSTRESDRTFYKQEASFLETAFVYTLQTNMAVELDGSFMASNLYQGAKGPSIGFSDPGTGEFYFGSEYQDRIDLAHVNLRFHLNTAVNPARPKDGWVAELAGGYHTQVNGNDFGYWDNEVLIGKYLPLFYDRILYVDLAGRFTEPTANRSIPLFEYPDLGGFDTLRGFQRGRYSGEHTVHGTVEYRFPLRELWGESGLEFAFIADWGKVVQEDASDWDADGVQIGYGFSLQTWRFDGWGARFDVGFSREGARAYLVIGV